MIVLPDTLTHRRHRIGESGHLFVLTRLSGLLVAVVAVVTYLPLLFGPRLRSLISIDTKDQRFIAAGCKTGY